MIESYLTPIFILALGINTLIWGRREQFKTTLLNTLMLSLLISYFTKVMYGVLFASLFMPLIYFSNGHLKNKKSHQRSTIGEKAVLYLGLLPSFGLFFLFKEKLEQGLGQLVISSSVVRTTEILMIFLLAIFLFLKAKRRRRR